MGPILNQIGTIFIPVSNLKQARDWYCDILGLAADGEILFEHLYIIPMEGTDIVLDSKIFSKEKVFQVPAFHFNTKDIHEAYQYMKSKNVNLTTSIQNNWFNFKDPDGNLLMVCQC